MEVFLKNGVIPEGDVILPPSKSEAIRAAILFALAGEDPRRAVDGFTPPFCDDIAASLEAVRSERPYVGESAALMRMLLPVLLARHGRAEILAGPRVLERGVSELEECLGVSALRTEKGLVIEKKLEESRYFIDCSRSSQFLSGFLIALPLLGHECAIVIKNGLVSKPYALMTLDLVRRFGGVIDTAPDGFLISPSVYTAPKEAPVTGDESYAAVFRAMNRLGGRVNIIGSSEKTLQPDRDFDRLAELSDCEVSDCPDLAPILAVCACARRGDTVLRGTARLRSKESDRESGVVRLINDLGGSAEIADNAVVIHGSGRLKGGRCSSLNDHRLAFSAAVAAMISDSPVVLGGAECVSKSAPGFWGEIEALGVRVTSS